MGKKSTSSRINPKNFPTLNLIKEKDIALDFATKIYQKFSKLIKSVVLFGSAAKNSNVAGSDIDIMIILDDTAVNMDAEITAWYREELGKIISANPYRQELHINTVKLTTWWQDLIRGDPTLINIIRYGEAIIDFGGFFNPLKVLLAQGKIKPSAEAIYACLQRAPEHLIRSKQAQISSIEGVYWAMVDSSHAALIASKTIPPSPEHISEMLIENYVKTKKLDSKYVDWYAEVFKLYKEIMHGDIKIIKGQDIETYQKRADEFIGVMAKLVNETVKV